MAERDDDGWVELEKPRPGDLFETEAGRQYVCLADNTGYTETASVMSLKDGVESFLVSDLPVRPLTAVRVHPSLDSDLRAMLLAALATGDPVALGALGDMIQDRGLDPDARRAVIERCAKAAERCGIEVPLPYARHVARRIRLTLAAAVGEVQDG